MKIDELRAIGRSLFQELPEAIHAPGRKTALGIGAAGDETFPVDSLAEEIIIKGLELLTKGKRHV